MQRAPVSNGHFEFRQSATVEEQSILFSQMSGVLVPTLTAGTKVFLREFGSWLRGYSRSDSGVRVVLSPDPSYAIVFPTPIEDLQSTAECARRSHRDSLEELLAQFGLSHDTCRQASFTLSGGERALVALAKCFLLLPESVSAVICNPSRWLHPGRRHLIWDTLRQCSQQATPAVLLSLQGEIGPARPAADDTVLRGLALKGTPWRLSITRPVVEFPASEFPAPIPKKRIVFDCDDSGKEILSPTVVTGDNAIGKSTFAKMLAHIVAVAEGSVSASCGGYTTTPRLLFQEAPRQLLALEPLEHMKWIYAYDAARHDEAYQVFHKLQSRTAAIAVTPGAPVTIGSDMRPNTLLQAKLALVAERLVCNSRMLILDEPSWGFSQGLADAFLSAVLEEAESRGIAVLVISHDTNLPTALFFSEIRFAQGQSASEVRLSVVCRERGGA